MTGQEIKNIRIRTGKTQWEFGALLGYIHPQIRMSEVETGKKRMSKSKQGAVSAIGQFLQEKRGCAGSLYPAVGSD